MRDITATQVLILERMNGIVSPLEMGEPYAYKLQSNADETDTSKAVRDITAL